VYLIPCDHEIKGLELLIFARKMLNRRNTLKKNYNGVIFPMVHINHIPDLKPFEGMTIYKDDLFEGILAVLLQENSLGLDHLGAKVKSATASLTRLCKLMPPLTIDIPYVFTLVREDVIHFIALCGQDSWRNPSDNNPLIIKD
jgi:hypothetical protein